MVKVVWLKFPAPAWGILNEDYFKTIACPS